MEAPVGSAMNMRPTGIARTPVKTAATNAIHA